MKDHSLNFLELVNESLKFINECDIFKVKDLQDNKQEFVLIDVLFLKSLFFVYLKSCYTLYNLNPFL